MRKRLELFVCPVCKTKNDESQKYCTGCGHWLLSETFSATKHKADKNVDRLYICAFCDTANEPNRNACKKCFKPLFSTEYETKEIKVKNSTRGSNGKWLKRVYLVFGIPLLLLTILLLTSSTANKLSTLGNISLLSGLLGIGITIIAAIVLLIAGRLGPNKKNVGSLFLTTIVLLVIGITITAKTQGGPAISTNTPTPPAIETTQQPDADKPKIGITKEEFDQLQAGMSYEQVTEILNFPGVLQAENGFKGDKNYQAIYVYSGDGSQPASVTLTFQGNKLTNKVQSGLK